MFWMIAGCTMLGGTPDDSETTEERSLCGNLGYTDSGFANLNEIGEPEEDLSVPPAQSEVDSLCSGGQEYLDYEDGWCDLVLELEDLYEFEPMAECQ